MEVDEVTPIEPPEEDKSEDEHMSESDNLDL